MMSCLCIVRNWLILLTLDCSRSILIDAYRCQTRPILIETSRNGIALSPSFISVYRCRGGQWPQSYQCQPKQLKILEVRARSLDGILVTLKISNHTLCREVCVCGRCLGGNFAEPFCELPTVWNPESCRCDTVFCPSVLNVKVKDEVLKEASATGVSYTTFALLSLVEFVVIAFGFVILKKWREHLDKRQRRTNLVTSYSTENILQERTYSSTDTANLI